MTDHLISQFIDDELDMDEKIEFVDNVHGDGGYHKETVGLLAQEIELRGDPVRIVPPVAYPASSKPKRYNWFRPLAVGLGAAAMLVIFWQAVVSNRPITVQHTSKLHRFIIYRPDVSRVEISGSFTNWQPHTMSRIGNTGYWEAEIELSRGEHRFAYILDGGRQMADPTVQAREKDDFGGENSILSVSL